ncbi:MAG: nickel-dependent hydrogenase large subunit [Acidithiobacillus sp.]
MRGSWEDLEGGITVAVRLERGYVADVTVASTRRPELCRVLEGMPVEAVPSMVSLLFRVCSAAQECAAHTACEQIAGLPPAPGEQSRRQIRVVLETFREHSWAACIEWPRRLGMAPDVGAFASIRSALQAIGEGLPGWPDKPLEEEKLQVLAQAVDQALALEERIWEGPAALHSWAMAGTCPAARFLQKVGDEDLAEFGRCSLRPVPDMMAWDLDGVLAADVDNRFVGRPEWEGEACETGPLVRMSGHPLVVELWQRYGNGLLTRFAARLVELVGLPARLGQLLDGLSSNNGSLGIGGNGVGLGQVEAARGRLAHRVKAEAGRVSRYQILAPTEWNFHPRGPLWRGLVGRPAGNADILQRQVGFLVVALDPCVAFTVQVT